MKRIILYILILTLSMVLEVAKGDFVFSTPTEVPNVNSSSRDLKPSVSSDGLSLFFTSTRPGGVGGLDIWVATRATTDDQWGEPVNLGLPVCSSAWESGSISHDGLSFYFSSTRNRGGNADIWVTTRETIDSEWGTPINLGSTVNSSADQCYTSISSDELELYFSSNRSGGHGAYDLWVTIRETIHDPWSTPVNLGETINTSAYEVDPSISADGRILFFTSTNSPSSQTDIWMSMRATTDDQWGEPVNLGPTINSSASEDYPSISADGSTLYFRYSQSGRYSGGDIWQAPIIPIVDLNADGIVDAADMCIMVDYWGTDEPLCDIGPMPWGDGIVNVEDLIVLAEHLFEEVNDPTLIAHWALDETEGSIAYDSASSHNATLSGYPIWQPTEGKIDGALQLDGIDDYGNAGFVLNPSSGSFSAYAWIKGGTPGQVIISQADGTGFGGTWLGIDQSDGKLFTNLMYFDLVSKSVITDDQWHHAGIVWDGSRRSLYVDEEEVARDTNDMTAIESNGDLYLGAGKNLETTSFFSGLIDNVRIYDIALTAEEVAALAQ